MKFVIDRPANALDACLLDGATIATSNVQLAVTVAATRKMARAQTGALTVSMEISAINRVMTDVRFVKEILEHA